MTFRLSGRAGASLMGLHAAVVTALAVVAACGPGRQGIGESAATVAPRRVAPHYRIVDVMPSFWRFWAQAEGKPAVAQRALFRRLVVSPHPTLFTAGVLRLDPRLPAEQALDARIDRFLGDLPRLAPAMRRISAALSAQLGRYDRRFREVFPDFAYGGDLYVTLSLGSFDGGMRQVGRARPLLFAVDGMAMFHAPGADPAAFFHHELFHLYHLQHVPEPARPAIWMALWFEGLAVYVSQRLNPRASARELLLGDLPETVPPRLGEIVPLLLAELDSGSPLVYAKFFLKSGDGTVPRRCGYYLGLRVAEALGRGRTLRSLARLQGPALRREVEAALRALAPARGR